MLNWRPLSQINILMYDLDIDPMILTLDLDMVKMYHHTKNEVYSLNRWVHTERQTCTQKNRHTDTMKTLPLCVR